MTIIGINTNNKIDYSKIHDIRIEHTRNQDYNLVAYSINKNFYRKTVLGTYKFYERACKDMEKIYADLFNKERICEIG